MISFSLLIGQPESLQLPMPDFLQADYDSLNRYLANIDWLSVFSGYVSSSDVYRRFCMQLYKAFTMFVPFRFKQPFAFNYPKHIQALFHQKQRLFETTHHPLSSSLYKKVCSDIEHHLRKFFANRERRLASQRFMAPLFQLVRNKLNPDLKLHVLTNRLGNRLTTDKTKAQALAEYFYSVFQSSSHHLPDLPLPPASASERRSPSLCIHPHMTLNLLKKLRTSTNEGYDGIPPIVYRKCADTLCVPLTHIFNISLLLGEVPDLWKYAMVTPIPKVTTPKSTSDFRPISITPTPAKIMESFINDKIYSWVKRLRLLPDEQFGFLAGKSTLANLADSMFEWCEALNSGLSVDIIYIDLSKAFDKVNHRMLLRKLSSIGISAQLIQWLCSYLENRH